MEWFIDNWEMVLASAIATATIVTRSTPTQDGSSNSPGRPPRRRRSPGK